MRNWKLYSTLACILLINKHTYDKYKKLKIKNAWNMKELVVSILEIFTVAGFASCGQQHVTDTGPVSESQTAKVLSVAHAPQGKSFYSDTLIEFF